MPAVFLSRRYPVRRADVFRAWTEPDLFRQWFGAPGGTTVISAMDVRPGGAYRVELRHPMVVGWTTSVVGEYLEVTPPERLVFTFAWDPNPPMALRMGASRVTVQFTDLGEATDVRLTHEQLDRRRLRAFHSWGWSYSARRLGRLLGAREAPA